MSDWYPETFELARTGRWEEAMERFWAVQPARQANAARHAGLHRRARTC